MQKIFENTQTSDFFVFFFAGRFGLKIKTIRKNFGDLWHSQNFQIIYFIFFLFCLKFQFYIQLIYIKTNFIKTNKFENLQTISD